MNSSGLAQQAPADWLDGGDLQAKRFFLCDAAPARGWSVAGGGWAADAPNSYAARRDFPCWELVYVAGGSGFAELSGRRHALSTGCAYALPPDMRRGRRSDPRRPLRRYYLWINGPGASALFDAAGLGSGIVRVSSTPGEIREVFDWLIREGGSCAGDPLVPRLLVNLLLAKLAKSIRPAKPTLLAGGADEEAARASYEKCIAALDTAAGRLRSTAELAAAVGLRSETVCRLFRRFANHTPGEIIRTARMRLAADLLSRPGSRVKEVAAALDFSDAFHFSRVFRQETGLSPRAWLARNR